MWCYFKLPTEYIVNQFKAIQILQHITYNHPESMDFIDVWAFCPIVWEICLVLG